MSNTPVFFCENCGSVVKDSDLRCPSCGKGFAGVKCPRCHHQGTTGDFADGCPKCHYKIGNPVSGTKMTGNESVDAPVKLPQTQDRPSTRRSSFNFPMVSFIFAMATLLIILLYNYAH